MPASVTWEVGVLSLTGLIPWQRLAFVSQRNNSPCSMRGLANVACPGPLDLL